jgi:hypothetical protein
MRYNGVGLFRALERGRNWNSGHDRKGGRCLTQIKKILVIDDEPSVIESVKAVFDGEFEMEEVESRRTE